MSQNNEMSALRCMGVSIFQVYIPLLCVGVVAFFLQLTNSEILLPSASKAATRLHALSDGIKRSKTPHFITFSNREAKRDWLIRTINDAGDCTFPLVQQFDKKKQLLWELRADSALYDASKKEWIFFNAIISKVDRDSFIKEGELKEKLVITDFNENPKSITFFSKLRSTEGFSILDTWQILHDPDVRMPKLTHRILFTSFFDRLFSPLSSLIAILLTVPLALITQRSGMIKTFMVQLGIMISFYILSDIFVSFGSNPYVPAIFAGAFLPMLYFSYSTIGLWRKM